MEKIQEESGRSDLLEQLSIKMNCQYLSDLRVMKCKYRCSAILSKIPAGEYTADAWNDAIYYITDEKTAYDTPEEAKKGMIFRLEKKDRK